MRQRGLGGTEPRLLDVTVMIVLASLADRWEVLRIFLFLRAQLLRPNTAVPVLRVSFLRCRCHVALH